MASKSKKSTNTVTTPTNSHGSEYWVNASKQIEWPVDFKERHISVPKSELERAQDNLMVRHFLNNGFFIQSCIPAFERTKVFDPDIKLKQRPRVRSEFELKDRFKILSTECELEISYMEGSKISLHYTNRDKHDITSNIEQLRLVLNMGVWERVEG